MLILFPAKDLENLKKTIKVIWESIPKSICENITEHMKHLWELCIKYNGRRINRELLKKIPKVGHDFKFRLKKKSINGIRISYNDKFIVKLKNKDIKDKTKKLVDQKKKEKIAKEKFDKLMKLKPKDYKNISDIEKDEIRFTCEYEKTQTQMLEEEIQKLEKMNALDYLSVLNEETKEKLIGLCMDRNLLDSDEETFGGTEENDSEEGEEKGLEEDNEF